MTENRAAVSSLINRTAHSGTEIGLLEQTLRFLSQQQVGDCDTYRCHAAYRDLCNRTV